MVIFAFRVEIEANKFIGLDNIFSKQDNRTNSYENMFSIADIILTKRNSCLSNIIDLTILYQWFAQAISEVNSKFIYNIILHTDHYIGGA